MTDAMATEPRRVELTAQKCMEYGAMAYGRKADQGTAGYNPLGATAQKGCANCLFFMASMDACQVVDAYPSPIVPNGLCTAYWTAIPSPKAMPLEVVIVGGMPGMDMAGKARTEDGVEYQASDYAVMPDPDKPSTWKLRMAEGSSGHMTVAQIGRAITAMQPGGFRGNQVMMTDDNHAQAMSRIMAAINKLDAGDDQKASLKKRLSAVKEAGEPGLLGRIMAAVKAAFVAGDGNDDPGGLGRVTAPLVLMKGIEARLAEEQSGLKIYKETSGMYDRWFAWVSNKWRDRDIPPEILEDAAHKEFIAYLDGGGAMPEAWLWHTPGTRWGVADWADYSDGFLLISGIVDKDAAAQGVAAALDGEALGVSHGFRQVYSDKGAGVIGWYRTFEVSPLPPDAAANPWTGLEMVRKELGMAMNPRKREWLEGKLGKERVAALVDDTAALAKALEAAGVDTKEMPSDMVSPPGAKEIGAAAAAAILESAAFKGLGDGLAGLKAQADQQGATLAAFDTRLKALEQSDDAKIAAAFTSAAAKAVGAGGYRASQDGRTALGDSPADQALKDALPAAPVIDKGFMASLRG